MKFSKSKIWVLSGYSDSDWGSSYGRKSTTGYVFSLNKNGPVIQWKAKKQPTIALSTCEAEYMAVCNAAQEATYLSRLLHSLKVLNVSNDPVIVNVDNQGTIELSKNPVYHQRTKHIDIKFHYIRECVNENRIKLVYIPSGENVADIMTKPATKEKLLKFVKFLFGEV